MLTPRKRESAEARRRADMERQLAASGDRLVERIDRIRRKVKARAHAVTRVDISVGWASAPGEVP